jgi:O-antigen/teichoic acid export membrane protein
MCLLAMVFSSDWMLRAAERFIQLGIAQSVSVTIYVVIVILFAHLYPAVQSLLWAHVLQALMVAGMQWRMLPPNLLRIKFAPLSISLLTRYVGRGGFFAVTGALYQGAITGFLWGTGKIFGNHVLGLTTALMRIYQLINAGSFMLAVGYFPRLAREHCKSEVNSLRRLMGFSGVLFALLFPLIIVPIAGLVLGSSFREINFLAYGASLGLFFGAMRYVYSIPLAAQIRHWEAVVANSLYFLIALCAPFLLAQWLSFEWVSLSISMAELMAFFGMLISIKLLGKGNA